MFWSQFLQERLYEALKSELRGVTLTEKSHNSCMDLLLKATKIIKYNENVLEKRKLR